MRSFVLPDLPPEPQASRRIHHFQTNKTAKMRLIRLVGLRRQFAPTIGPDFGPWTIAEVSSGSKFHKSKIVFQFRIIIKVHLVAAAFPIHGPVRSRVDISLFRDTQSDSCSVPNERRFLRF